MKDEETFMAPEEATRQRTGVLQIIRNNLVAVVIIVALIAGYFLLRTTPSDVSSMEELQTLSNSGKPTLVEFYSNT